MDKQIMAVKLSFLLYALYVLLPMIPAIFIYRIFPDTKVSAKGILANFKIKTTGAFAAYVVTVFLGYFIVQQTHHLIAQICYPVWTVKTEVKLLNADKTPYNNQQLLETLNVTIDPEIQRVKGGKVILQLPGSYDSLENTQLIFDVPNFGHEQIDLGEAFKNANLDNYKLRIHFNEPVLIVADEQQFKEYSYDTANKELLPAVDWGPKFRNSGR